MTRPLLATSLMALALMTASGCVKPTIEGRQDWVPAPLLAKLAKAVTIRNEIFHGGKGDLKSSTNLKIAMRFGLCATRRFIQLTRVTSFGGL